MVAAKGKGAKKGSSKGVKDANLLITYDPSKPGKAKSEVEAVIGEVGSKASFLEGDVQGLFFVKVPKVKEIVKKLLKMGEKKPESFVCTFHYVPIDEWSTSNVKTMQKVIGKLAGKIDDKEKWKMNLNKRGYDEDYGKLIVALTDPIEKPNVDLENADKTVQVEIVGKIAGISLLEKDELLETPKLKK